MRTCLITACLAAGLTVPVCAVHGQTGYVLELVSDRDVLTPEEPEATITVYMGWFGEGGYGPWGFDGSVTSSHPTLAMGDIFDPFGDLNFITATPTSLSGVIPRDERDAPPFSDPGPYGVDELVPVFSFSIHASLFSDVYDVQINGTSETTLIEDWGYFGWWIPFGTRISTAIAELHLTVVPSPAPLILLGGGAAVVGLSRRRIHPV